MYNPAISIRHQALKLAAISLCALIGLVPFVSRADAQTPPAQPQAAGNPDLIDNQAKGINATYTGLVMSIVRQQWTVPPRSHRGNLVASVRIRLSIDGTIELAVLENSSGNPAYDASVLSAVNKVSSLPKPPHPGLQNLLLNFNYN